MNTVTHLASSRTIPANTGRITAQTPAPVTEPDHPREYGENIMVHDMGAVI